MSIRRTFVLTSLRPRGFITRGAAAVHMGRLTGRVALVTGGSGGIGRVAALELAREGADVAVQYHRSEEGAKAVVEGVRSMGRKAVAVHADVSDPRECRSLSADVMSKLGRID